MGQIDFINASLWYGEVIALNEVSFKITPGITGLVGSNGAGKTSSIKLATSLLKPTLGEVNFNGDPVWQNYEYLRQLGYSPEIDRQFNFMTGRKFLEFAGKLHKLSNQDNQNSVNDILKIIGMRHAADRKISEYSRGMRQRIILARAFALEPDLLIADEPTTALDVTIQAQVLEIIKNLREQYGMSLMLITHDLGVVAEITERVHVFYGGNVVESGLTKEVFQSPKHPYTKALISSIPSLAQDRTELDVIPGNVPQLINPPTGCRFNPRCAYKQDKCEIDKPELQIYNTRKVACHFTNEIENGTIS